MHSPQRVILGPILMTNGRCQPHQIGKLLFVPRVENALFRPHTENDLLAALEISRIMRNPRLGEFEPMPPKRNRRGREHHHFRLWQNAANARHRSRKAFARQAFIDGVHQPGCHVAAIAGIHRHERVLPLVEFVQTPFRCRWMQMRHTLPGQRHRALRHNHRQPFDHAAFLLGQPERIEPKNSAGQRAIDGRLRFLVVHSHDGQGALSLAQPPTQVSRAKRVFKIHAGGKPDDGPFRKISLQRPAQARLVGDTRRPSRGRRTLIAIAAKVQPRRPILPHALHLQPQCRPFDFRIQHPPHKIPFARPKMQQAFVVLAGHGIFRFCQVECDGAIFHHHCGTCAVEKVGEHLAERVWGHKSELFAPPAPASVTVAP